MKKLCSLLLVALMLFGITSALAESFVMNEENFLSEQGPVWFYRFYSEEEDAIRDLTLMPEWGDNWQFSATPQADEVYHSLCEWDGIQAMPGTWLGKHVDMLLVFVAPKDGKITIAPMSFIIKDDGNEWEPYLVQIQKYDQETQEVTNLLGDDWQKTPYETEAMELEIKAGDELRFVVRSTGSGGAAVSVQPTITYAE